MIVGAFPEAAFRTSPLQMNAGDVLVVYSDGLTDAENPAGQMLGEDLVKNVILSEARGGAGRLEEKLLETIQSFTEGRSQTDDITMMIVERV
jgi:sigma-B regulation protein RsbU (phosphoserine phosphatase)